MEQFIEFIGNNPVLSMIWVGLAGAIIVSYVKAQFSPIKQINTTELTLLVNRENAVVLDIRPLKDFNQGHIAGAVHLDAEKAKQKQFSQIEKHKSDPIIVVCAAGMTAQTVASLLNKEGFGKVNVLSGGMGSWQAASLPTASR